MDDDPFNEKSELIAETIKWILIGLIGSHVFYMFIPESSNPQAVTASVLTGLVAIGLSFLLFPNE